MSSQPEDVPQAGPSRRPDDEHFEDASSELTPLEDEEETIEPTFVTTI